MLPNEEMISTEEGKDSKVELFEHRSAGNTGEEMKGRGATNDKTVQHWRSLACFFLKLKSVTTVCS